MKLWQTIVLLIITFFFFWWLSCYGAEAKPKRCQTCCPHLPSPTVHYNDLFDKYKIVVPIDGEARNFNLTITKKEPGNQIIVYDLEDVKSEKTTTGIEGILYYRTFHITLFTVITDSCGDLVRTLDCVFDPVHDDDFQSKGDCIYIGVGKFNVPKYENIPLVATGSN